MIWILELVGCDTASGCVVHLEGKAVKSCTMLAVQANGKNITTIEGIADGDNLHPVQEAFRDHQVQWFVHLNNGCNRYY